MEVEEGPLRLCLSSLEIWQLFRPLVQHKIVAGSDNWHDVNHYQFGTGMTYGSLPLLLLVAICAAHELVEGIGEPAPQLCG